MAKYLARACPRCGDYVDVIVHGVDATTPSTRLMVSA
jgi:hypothetical protein